MQQTSLFSFGFGQSLQYVQIKRKNTKYKRKKENDLLNLERYLVLAKTCTSCNTLMFMKIFLKVHELSLIFKQQEI